MEFLNPMLAHLPVIPTLLVSIVVASLLVYVPFLPVAYARLRVGYNWSAPRNMFDKLPDYAQRATWAHQNAFESLIIFAPAALMAIATQVTSPWASSAAVAYLVARLLHSVFYILDVPIARSLMFAIASLASYTLFALSLKSAALF